MGNKSSKEKKEHSGSDHGSKSSSSSSSHTSFSHHEQSSLSGIDRSSSIKECERSSHHHGESPGIMEKATDKVKEAAEETKEGTHSLIYKMKKLGVHSGKQKGNDYTLYLDLENNYDGVNEFLTLTDELRFETLKKVSLAIANVVV